MAADHFWLLKIKRSPWEYATQPLQSMCQQEKHLPNLRKQAQGQTIIRKRGQKADSHKKAENIKK